METKLVQEVPRDKPIGTFHWSKVQGEFENVIDSEERLATGEFPVITSCIYCDKKLTLFSRAIVILPAILTPTGLMISNHAEKEKSASGMVFCSPECIVQCYKEVAAVHSRAQKPIILPTEERL